ncbi:MAG TPA: 4Fe-4S dicluster domain-containing protein, partial [Thermoleophilia bacterium]|nr:4Fe-4S dicluster domain-containing protein [Thermoleophilia bacterium]
QPANLEMISAAHLEHAALAAADDARQAWRRFPSALSTGADLPWRRVLGPSELGVPLADCAGSATVAGSGANGGGAPAARSATGRPAAYLYVDFLDAGAARRFATHLADLPGAPVVFDRESVVFAGARFRPQAGKRLGPGLLAAEIDLPAAAVPAFLADAERLAAGAGVALEHEVYYLSGGRALAIAGYLTDHRSLAFLPELALSPALLDLAVRSHGGRPYVLGRWQGSFARDKFGDSDLARLVAAKIALDPARLLGRGVLFGLDLRGPLGSVVERVYRPGVRLAALAWGSPAGPAVRLASAALRYVPGPGHRRGEPVRGEAARRQAAGGMPVGTGPAAAPPASLPVLSRPLHCVNCGECNAVCPLYDALALRLPQSLVHAAETAGARRALPAGAAELLDLCLRCGSCEQVCQAGIAHLATYAALEALRPTDAAGDAPSGDRRAARQATLAALRRTPRYRRAFLELRPGEYLRRTPASVPGRVSYLVLRAEADDGAASTCRHCAACVAVCPSGANREFEADDARLITTEQGDCVGCGTCVEVCPANRDNGGQTLRVVEAPAASWLAALDEFEALAAHAPAVRDGGGVGSVQR